jgi:membrane dipeptidase
MLRRLGARGGVIMINFGSAFVRADSNAVSEKRKALGAAYASEQHPDTKLAADREKIGLGSDYEGVGPKLPVGLEDVARYPNLLLELLEHGYTEDELERICSGNVLRVWQAVLDYAAAARTHG